MSPSKSSRRSAAPKAAVRFSLHAPATATKPKLPWLKRLLLRVVSELRLSRVKIDFVIIGDAEMAELHERFTGVKGTTDVLTFDLAGDPPLAGARAKAAPRIEGEVYLCLDEARRRAEELGHSADHELLLYAVHGLLHLLGYDDHAPAERRRMHEEEDRLLTAAGAGAVFHATRRGARR